MQTTKRTQPDAAAAREGAMTARGYADEMKRLLDALDESQVERLVSLLTAAWRSDRSVLLMGNGGSGSTVSHIVADLQKNVKLGTGRPIRALSLADCAPLVSAWANDTLWENIFAPQVETWAKAGDLVIGVSGSGNSMNVIRGVEAARRIGATTFGLCGFGGGKLQQIADYCLVIDSDNMQRVEDMHMIVLHMAYLRVLDLLKSETPPG